MTDYVPKVMEMPGVPGTIREQTLEEFMAALPLEHLAQRQLADLRRMALDGAKATGELVTALREINALKDQLRPQTVSTSVPVDPNPFLTTVPVSPVPEPPTETWPKKPCPQCGVLTSTRPGPWAAHLKRHESSPTSKTSRKSNPPPAAA